MHSSVSLRWAAAAVGMLPPLRCGLFALGASPWLVQDCQSVVFLPLRLTASVMVTR